ncbi:MAG: hypothetical protein ACQ9MH_17185 [Nitrospinales bacterium]
MIQEAFSRLDNYCKHLNYSGWDLFDGLNSSLFRHSPFYRSAFFRLIWIQFFKRSPINLRRIALIPKGLNPKGLGLFSSGLIALGRIKEAELLLSQLSYLRSSGYSGISWGYNFPWQAKAFYVPTGKPNAIATIFVANAFLDFFEKTSSQDAIETARKCCDFIIENLVLHEDKETLCFGYVPGEGARVHNVNMLAAALLGRVYRYTKDPMLIEKSRKAITYSMQALPAGSFWPYGELPHHCFIDNFHTGFNLVALKAWMDATGEYIWMNQLESVYQNYLEIFWLENGCPKYYDNKAYPIDIHCAAQGVVTCIKLSGIHPESPVMAERIAKWAINTMQDKNGFFYYQETRFYTNKIAYIRWSQAWMFYALSLYIAKLGGNEQ